jgi:hypothetical protein
MTVSGTDGTAANPQYPNAAQMGEIEVPSAAK